MTKASNYYPKNKFIRNSKLSQLYINLLKRKNILGSLLGRLIGCEISCHIPEILFLPHPNGIIVGKYVKLENYVVLNHQITLGGKDPYFQGNTTENEYPHIKEGVYIGPGSKILGPCTIGEWAIIGANTVVTKDIPAHSTVVGCNKIIEIRKA